MERFVITKNGLTDSMPKQLRVRYSALVFPVVRFICILGYHL